MTSALAIADPADVLERVITQGDLSRLTPADRVAYYRAVCASVNLNPLTKPFDYINLNGKLTLYATKTATDQLRSIKGISIDGAERDLADGEFATWLVTGHDASGRSDMEIGSVSIKGLAGEARANAIMKALTKGKRRLTLSLAGLGWLDETEVGSIPSAVAATVDMDTGEISRAPLSLPEVIAEKAAAVADPTAAARPTSATPGTVAAPGSASTSSTDEPPMPPEPPMRARPQEPRHLAASGEDDGPSATASSPVTDDLCASVSPYDQEQTCVRERGHSVKLMCRDAIGMATWPRPA